MFFHSDWKILEFSYHTYHIGLCVDASIIGATVINSSKYEGTPKTSNYERHQCYVKQMSHKRNITSTIRPPDVLGMSRKDVYATYSRCANALKNMSPGCKCTFRTDIPATYVCYLGSYFFLLLKLFLLYFLVVK